MLSMLADHPWLDLAIASATLVGETDRAGRIMLVRPEAALGWTTKDLVGQPADAILANIGNFNPFRAIEPLRQVPCWLKRGDGGTECLNVSVVPMRDDEGAVIGARFLFAALAEPDKAAADTAAALRRADLLDHILRSLRVELPPDRMMQQTLRTLVTTLGADGALVIEATAQSPAAETGPALGTAAAGTIKSGIASAGIASVGIASVGIAAVGIAAVGIPDVVTAAGLPAAVGIAVGGGAVLHEAGGDGANIVAAAIHNLRAVAGNTCSSAIIDGQPMILCPCPTRFGADCGLVLWRRENARRWSADDVAIAASVAGLIRVLLEHGAVQTELATDARTDPVTGLPNRSSFLAEIPRHIDRLDRDGQPGTLMLISIDRFRHLGPEARDEALRILTGLLRITFRPTDVIARLGRADFAVWLNGADALTAAERAASLTTEGVRHFDDLAVGQLRLGLAIGMALREPAGADDLEELRGRAEHALEQVRLTGLSGWKVWHG